MPYDIEDANGDDGRDREAERIDEFEDEGDTNFEVGGPDSD